MKKIMYLAHALHQTQSEIHRGSKKRKEINRADAEDEKDLEGNQSSQKKRSRKNKEEISDEDHNLEEEEEDSLPSYEVSMLPSLTAKHWKDLITSKVKMGILEDAMKKHWSFDPNRKELVKPSSSTTQLTKEERISFRKPQLKTFAQIRKKVHHPNFISDKILEEYADRLKAEIL